MFAKKRKETAYAALAEHRRMEEQQRIDVVRGASQPAASSPVPPNRTEKVYLESEIINEYPAPVPAKQPGKLYLESEIIIEEPKLVPVEEFGALEELTPAEGYEKTESAEILEADELVSDALEEVPLEDIAEIPEKPSKLAKLPGLIDLMLTMNLSKSVRMNFAMLLLKQFEKYKNSPKEKAIIVECLKKLLASLSKG